MMVGLGADTCQKEPNNQVVILMADREGNFAEFVVDGDEFQEHRLLWAKRLAKYYNL